MKKKLMAISFILFSIIWIYPVSKSDKVLDTVGFIEQWGYPAESYNVTTDDGYILNIFRIPWSPVSKNTTEKKPVIYVQCPLESSSDIWVLGGFNRSIVRQLADEGFDVWIGNYRGSTYGKNHVKLSSNDSQFWDFSLDDIGYHDITSIIDYVLNATNEESLFYLGMSMGTTTFFIALSERPEYNKKVKLFIGFCPVAGFFNKSRIDTIVFTVAQTIVNLINSAGTFEFLPQDPVYKNFADICLKYNIPGLCYIPMDFFFGRDRDQVDFIWFANFLSYFPAGTSGKVLLHYGQFSQYQNLQKFDYQDGNTNMQHYGNPKPPSYNMKNFKVPMLYFYSENDPLSTPNDLLELTNRVSSKVIAEKVPFKYFNHFDFIIANDVKKLLYDRVIERLNEFVSGKKL